MYAKKQATRAVAVSIASAIKFSRTKGYSDPPGTRNPVPGPRTHRESSARFIHEVGAYLPAGVHTSRLSPNAPRTHKIKHLNYETGIFPMASVPGYWWPKR